MKILFIQEMLLIEEKSKASQLLETSNLYSMIAVILSFAAIILSIYSFKKRKTEDVLKDVSDPSNVILDDFPTLDNKSK